MHFGRSLLALAALLLGLGPVHALVAGSCKLDVSIAQNMDAKGGACDCEASGCQSGQALFCGQCLNAIGAAVDSHDLSHPVLRLALPLVRMSWRGRTLEPPVPPPEQAA